MLKESLPNTIQALKFSSNQMEISAKLDPSRYERVRPLLVKDGRHEISVYFIGSVNEVGEKQILLRLQGSVEVTCQTCFNPMAVAIDSEVALVPVFNDEQAGQLVGEKEPLMLDENAHFEPSAVVEDEILLCIPTANNHTPEECDVSLVAYEPEEIEPAPAKDNPFAALKDLKKNLSSKK